MITNLSLLLNKRDFTISSILDTSAIVVVGDTPWMTSILKLFEKNLIRRFIMSRQYRQLKRNFDRRSLTALLQSIVSLKPLESILFAASTILRLRYR